MNKRIKKKKSHPLLNPVTVAYIVATKINTQCPGFASDFKLTHRKLKRCLMYHYYIFKHNRKSLSHLYYTEPTLNKRYYSPECVFDAICRSHRRYNGDHDHPVGGEHVMYTSTESAFNSNDHGQSQAETPQLTIDFNPQFVQSEYVDELAEKYERLFTSSGVQFAPRIHDGRIISIDLCKEEN